MIHNGLRRSFAREVCETGYSRAPQLWAYTGYVSELTVIFRYIIPVVFYAN